MEKILLLSHWAERHYGSLLAKFVRLRTFHGRFHEPGANGALTQRERETDFETFRVVREEGDALALQTCTGAFLSAFPWGVAIQPRKSTWETFTEVASSDGKVAFRTRRGNSGYALRPIRTPASTTPRSLLAGSTFDLRSCEPWSGTLQVVSLRSAHGYASAPAERPVCWVSWVELVGTLHGSTRRWGACLLSKRSQNLSKCAERHWRNCLDAALSRMGALCHRARFAGASGRQDGP